MKKVAILIFTVFSYLVADSKSDELEKCLLECYRVNGVAVSEILADFAMLQEEYDVVVRLFIEESRKLNIYAGEPSMVVSPTLPPHHSVLFENPYVRISRAVTRCGEQEPPQRHPWKTLIVVIQPAQFYSLKEDGTSYEDHWPAGTYLLDPSSELLTCKNIGHSEYHGLSFELKAN